jgi:hypothetical protein
MRKSKLTFDEILKAEQASDARHQSRKQGFAKMHERDQAMQTLSNGVTMLWYVDRELNKQEGTISIDGKDTEITVYPPQIPEDSFALVIEGRKHIFNTEEFRKWLRWA